MPKTTLSRWQLLLSVHVELPRQGGLPGVLPQGNGSYWRQTVHRARVDRGVSELARGNELSWDHVNRP